MKIFSLAIFFMSFTYGSLGHASVKSISPETESNGENGVTEKFVTVSCNGQKESRKLRWVDEKKKWCDTNFDQYCASKKITASLEVCGREYRNLLQVKMQPNTVPVGMSTVKKVPREQRRLELVSELLSIKERQLDIRKRLIELSKREQALIE